MHGRRFFLALLAGLTPFGAIAESGPYLPYSGIARGTEGTTPVAVTIRNDTGSPLTCQAALAHWYSADLGRLPPGGTLPVGLHHDPENGEISLLNDSADRMPVEAIWCGSPQSPETARTRLTLPIRRGAAPAALIFVCTVEPDGTIACGQEG
ncbi:hypothetical protein [Sedimentitalea todarodis]|uniref:Uncharacterized protein n=1 Tax=Sedimentitalea todarodis TaxID=1631240 RepID=A0ABU3VKI7_9RHOB|nr:hypothetical protein [Sedimentitalea todarodis]MDU9006711.1 hypothetical protein [Sedimentitalea todarodis]